MMNILQPSRTKGHAHHFTPVFKINLRPFAKFAVKEFPRSNTPTRHDPPFALFAFYAVPNPSKNQATPSLRQNSNDKIVPSQIGTSDTGTMGITCMHFEGTITVWKDDQGYGFITPIQGGPQVFIHISAVVDKSRRPALDDRVSYRVATDEQGRLQARQVRRPGESSGPRGASSTDYALYAAASTFLILTGILFLAGKLPLEIPMLYLVASALAFLTYWKDKAAARAERWRTPENTLHFLGVIGGWPGALIAQRLLRHKSRKASFQVIFWLSVLANIGVLALLLTPDGMAEYNIFREQLIQN